MIHKKFPTALREARSSFAEEYKEYETMWEAIRPAVPVQGPELPPNYDTGRIWFNKDGKPAHINARNYAPEEGTIPPYDVPESLYCCIDESDVPNVAKYGITASMVNEDATKPICLYTTDRHAHSAGFERVKKRGRISAGAFVDDTRVYGRYVTYEIDTAKLNLSKLQPKFATYEPLSWVYLADSIPSSACIECDGYYWGSSGTIA